MGIDGEKSINDMDCWRFGTRIMDMGMTPFYAENQRLRLIFCIDFVTCVPPKYTSHS